MSYTLGKIKGYINIAHRIDLDGKTCPKNQYLRELAQNAEDHGKMINRGKKLKCLIYPIDYDGVQKFAFEDDGDGFDSLESYRIKFENLGRFDAEENFGIGAKISCIAKNHYGVIYYSIPKANYNNRFLVLTYRDGEGYKTREYLGNNCDEILKNFKSSLNLMPLGNKKSGTFICLLGNNKNDDTFINGEGNYHHLKYMQKKYQNDFKYIDIDFHYGKGEVYPFKSSNNVINDFADPVIQAKFKTSADIEVSIVKINEIKKRLKKYPYDIKPFVGNYDFNGEAEKIFENGNAETIRRNLMISCPNLWVSIKLPPSYKHNATRSALFDANGNSFENLDESFIQEVQKLMPPVITKYVKKYLGENGEKKRRKESQAEWEKYETIMSFFLPEGENMPGGVLAKTKKTKNAPGGSRNKNTKPKKSPKLVNPTGKETSSLLKPTIYYISGEDFITKPHLSTDSIIAVNNTSEKNFVIHINKDHIFFKNIKDYLIRDRRPRHYCIDDDYLNEIIFYATTDLVEKVFCSQRIIEQHLTTTDFMNKFTSWDKSIIIPCLPAIPVKANADAKR